MIIKKELVLASRKKAEIVAELRKRDFRPFPKVHLRGQTRQRHLEEVVIVRVATGSGLRVFLLLVGIRASSS
jgi:pyruvate/2-oxoacid:ferredoxin oxidoreductase alpha subunit